MIVEINESSSNLSLIDSSSHRGCDDIETKGYTTYEISSSSEFDFNIERPKIFENLSNFSSESFSKKIIINSCTNKKKNFIKNNVMNIKQSKKYKPMLSKSVNSVKPTNRTLLRPIISIGTTTLPSRKNSLQIIRSHLENCNNEKENNEKNSLPMQSKILSKNFHKEIIEPLNCNEFSELIVTPCDLSTFKKKDIILSPIR